MTFVVISLSIVVLITIRFVVRWSILYPETLWDWDTENVQSIYNVEWPSDFLWGSATAAFQVEGHNAQSNWTMWENSTDEQGNPRIHKGQKSGDACDHLHRYREDMKIAAQDLGINSYRFSIAWSRIEPKQGEYNQEALQHYSNVIDACLENGIQPMITLHHFSHPLWFENIGSFEKEENIEHFLRFAETIFAAYSDRVKFWCTHNECGPFATMGWGLGVFPPGKNSLQQVGTVLLNLVKSHTQVYRKLKSMPNGDKVQIGLVKNIFQFDPWSRWNPIHWVICRFIDEVYNESLLGAIRDGIFQIRWRPFINMQVDVSFAKGATDFIGLNYYSNLLINIRRGIDASSGPPFKGWGRKGQVMTDFPYTTYPEGFYRALQRISTLDKPIIVTENGIPDNLDDRRQDWIERYLYAMHKAISEGVNVKGYQYWSLLDNFEWAEGYDMRFGLYAVDFETQERTLREGAKAYARIVKGGQ